MHTEFITLVPENVDLDPRMAKEISIKFIEAYGVLKGLVIKGSLKKSIKYGWESEARVITDPGSGKKEAYFIIHQMEKLSPEQKMTTSLLETIIPGENDEPHHIYKLVIECDRPQEATELMAMIPDQFHPMFVLEH